MPIGLAIADQIIDLMKNDSDFSSINLFVRGMTLKVPAQYYPYVEVEVLSANKFSDNAGQTRVDRYIGEIRFFARYQDITSVSNLIYEVPSYTSISQFAYDVRELFASGNNRSLNNLNDGTENWAVRRFETTDIQYGFGSASQTAVVWDNFAIVPFFCDVQKDY